MKVPWMLASAVVAIGCQPRRPRPRPRQHRRRRIVIAQPDRARAVGKLPVFQSNGRAFGDGLHAARHVCQCGPVTRRRAPGRRGRVGHLTSDMWIDCSLNPSHCFLGARKRSCAPHALTCARDATVRGDACVRARDGCSMPRTRGVRHGIGVVWGGETRCSVSAVHRYSQWQGETNRRVNAER